MASWIKPVEHVDVRDGALYFIGIRPRTDRAQWYFYARNSRGKVCSSTKPGMALRYVGSQKMRDVLAEKPDLVAIEVPADADKRWSRKTYRRAPRQKAG